MNFSTDQYFLSSFLRIKNDGVFLVNFLFINMTTLQINRIRLIVLHLKLVLPNKNASLSGIMLKFVSSLIHELCPLWRVLAELL